MKRLLFNLLTGLSLLLCAAFVISLVGMLTEDDGSAITVSVNESTGTWVKMTPSQVASWKRNWEVAEAVCSIAFAILPASRLVDYERDFKAQQRIAMGLCSNCRYDLRATPDRCPECGFIHDKIKSES